MRLLVLAMLLISFLLTSCLSKKTPNQTPVPRKERVSSPPLISNPKFPPGTCGLKFQIKSIEKQGKNITIYAKVLSVLGYGSGITRNFSTGETFRFTVMENQKIDFKINTPMKAQFNLIEEIGSSKAILKYHKSIN
jgi:hypothetical protein